MSDWDSAPIWFADFRLDPAQRRLARAGAPVDLGARAFDLLLVLVRQAGQLVGKGELMERVWPGVIVEEANLHVQVTALRKALGREAIATVPGRGYQFVLPLRAGTAAPPAPAATTLPPLLGRDDEFARAARALARSRFVTLTGAGGSGKTLLARHLAERCGIVDGAPPLWVDLLELSGPTAVLPAVAAVTGLPGTPRNGHELARALAGTRRWLVLDNAEHVLEPVAALVEALRRDAPGLVLLVTSQAPLRREGEVVLPLGGLAVPALPCSAEQAMQHAAVQLFVAHARQADRRFRFGDAQVDDVVAVCASLAGSALGLQLAAALLGQMPLAAVRDRLSRRETGPDAAAVEAAANVLRSALSWSHDLLTPAAQRVFRRLAVVQGPLPLALVRALAAEPEGGEVTDAALADLVDRSLVQCELAPGRPPRYRLLEAPRALALEQLQASGERALVLERLALALASLGDAWLRASHSGERALSEDPGLEAQLPVGADVATAFEQALQWPGLAGATAAARLSSLCPLAQPHLAADRVRWGLALGERAETPGLPPALRGTALLAATALIRHSDLGARKSLLARAAAAFREAGDLPGEFRALCLRAESAATAGRIVEAEALLARVRSLDDAAWPPGRRRLRWYTEGIVGGAAGDPARAVHAWRRHLDLVRQLKRPEVELVRALHSLAHDELAGGDAASALPRLLQAAETARQNRDREALLAYVLPTLLATRLALGDWAGARAAAAEGWPHARALDADAWWADHLAHLAACEGRHRSAARLLGLADAGYARINDGRQPLEQQAAAAAEAALREALGPLLLQSLRDEGRTPAAAGPLVPLALAAEDSGPPGSLA